jgi:hypothetical protein
VTWSLRSAIPWLVQNGFDEIAQLIGSELVALDIRH